MSHLLFCVTPRLAPVPAGSGELLPVLVCGDFNSTPNSPLLGFLTSSHLDYSQLSASVIAGYHQAGYRSRVIPVPLLPAEMGVGQDCTYRQLKGGGSGEVMGMDGGRTNSGGVSAVGGKGRGHNTRNERGADKANAPVAHTEFTASDMELEGVAAENCSVRTTRSVRGAKVGGRVMCGSSGSDSSHSRRGRGDEPRGAGLSLSGGGSSVEDNLQEGEGGGGGKVRSLASSTEDSAVESLESSLSSVTRQCLGVVTEGGGGSKGVNAKGSGGVNPKGNGGKNCPPDSGTPPREMPELSHPFKLVPAYPIASKSPSTITTYHQCAFETVDYIFFSPIACRTPSARGGAGRGGGRGRKKLTGFNLLERRVLPSTHTLLDLGPQPHQFLSSDHLLLQATFQLAW